MTRICNYIQNYENNVWKYLSDVFSLKLKASEIGFTNDLIFRIMSFYVNSQHKIEVYIKHGTNESKTGTDIDLFIQINYTNLFDSYKIQAKMINYFFRYKGLEKNRNFSQIENLINHSNSENAIPYHLFYNGEPFNRRLIIPKNNYGISIVDSNIILQIRQNKLANQNKLSTETYNSLYQYKKPLHTLFCPRLITVDKPKNDPIKKGVVKLEDIYVGKIYNKLKFKKNYNFSNNEIFKEEIVSDYGINKMNPNENSYLEIKRKIELDTLEKNFKMNLSKYRIILFE